MRLTAAHIDLDAGTVTRAGAVQPLAEREVQLLRYLAARPGQPVSRDELLTAVWGYAAGVRSRTVDTTMKTLRRKVEADPKKPDHLRSVRGVGYCFEPGDGVATPAGNLPRVPGAFFGRHEEIGQVVGAFAGGDRLVTLVGPGGIGKTRLALRLAERLAPASGAWFCDLADARVTGDVLATLARVFDVPLRRGEGIGALGRVLAAKVDVLVLLDNTEGLDDAACASLGELVAASGEARFLVTSRRPLRVTGERRVHVPVLPRAVATELLVERGRRVRADFGQAGDHEALGRIVDALEGIPLALELAAARAGTLGADALAERITGLEWLDRGPADAPDRHQTLSQAIRWTWDLLTEVQRSALSQLAVFAGGFTAEAAEAVLALPDGARPLDMVDALREWSLLVSREHPALGQVRLALYDAVGQFVREVRPPDDAVQVRHAAWVLRVGADLAAGADRHGGDLALRRLSAERDNLRAAIAHRAGPDPDAAVRAILQVDRVLVQHGLIAERVHALDHAVALARAADLRAEAHRQRADARFDHGDAGVDDDLDAALALAPDDAAMARVLATVCAIRLQEHRLDEAHDAGLRALRLQEARGDVGAQATLLSHLGLVHQGAGRADAAEEALSRALSLHRRVGNQTNAGRVLGHLGALAESQGRIDTAARYFGRSLESHRQVGYGPGVLRMEGNLALIAANRGRFAEAAERLTRVVDAARGTGDGITEGVGLLNLARAQMHLGHLEQAMESADEAALVLRQQGLVPFEVHALGTLGAARALAGRTALALAALDAAIDLAPDGRLVASLLVERAIALARAGQPGATDALARAEATLDEVDGPIHQWLAHGRALVLALLGQHEAAERAAAALDPPLNDRTWAVARELREGVLAAARNGNVDRYR